MFTMLMLLLWVAGMLSLPAAPFIGASMMFSAYKLGRRAARDEEQFVAAMMILAGLACAGEWIWWAIT